jgi:hypothetical protein
MGSPSDLLQLFKETSQTTNSLWQVKVYILKKKPVLSVHCVASLIAFCSKTHGLSRKLKTGFFCTVLMKHILQPTL